MFSPRARTAAAVSVPRARRERTAPAATSMVAVMSCWSASFASLRTRAISSRISFPVSAPSCFRRSPRLRSPWLREATASPPPQCCAQQQADGARDDQASSRVASDGIFDLTLHAFHVHVLPEASGPTEEIGGLLTVVGE